jgi:hypothetical protein
MKGRLPLQFSGEEGVDAGGVTREWYVVLVRQKFDPNMPYSVILPPKQPGISRTNLH